MNHNKAIVIDIEVRKCSPLRSPPIALKLMKQKLEGETPLTLQDIEEKLRKAEELRNNELARKQHHTDDKVSKVIERRNT